MKEASIIKIALSTFEYDRNLIGGAGVYALELSRWLQGLCELSVYSCGAYESPPDAFAASWYGTGAANVRYHRIPAFLRSHGVVAFFYYALSQKVLAGNDIFLVNDLSQGLTVHSNIPIVQILHHLPSSELEKSPTSTRSRVAIRMQATLEKRALKRAQAIICQSRDTMENASVRYPENAAKVTVIPNGVDVHRFAPAKGSYETTDCETPRLLCVARGLEVRKGIDCLIEAFADVQRVSPAKLVIVGKDSHGLKAELLTQARALGIADITFIDSVSQRDLISLYQQATMTIVPSLLEGFSRPTLESMACGTPVVGSAVGAIPELLNENSGVLTPPGDARSLASAIINLLQDTKKVKRLGIAARERAVACFSWENIAKRVLSVCEQTVSG
ncbi:MAG: glycosyltransferase family 4 protein [Halobacteriota archaeon]